MSVIECPNCGYMIVKSQRCPVCRTVLNPRKFKAKDYMFPVMLAVPFVPPNPVRNPVGKSPKVYSSFHGSQPINRRIVKMHLPEGALVKIGRLVSLDYQPEGSSKYKRIQFTHAFGDTGEKKFASNSILATDSKGEGLYIIKDDPTKKRPYFNNRGIIG